MHPSKDSPSLSVDKGVGKTYPTNRSPSSHGSTPTPPPPDQSSSASTAPGVPPLSRTPGPSCARQPPELSGITFFPHSHNISIGSLTTNSVLAKSLDDLLQPHVCHGAAHDSNERCDAPACHEETRVAIRQSIVSWIKHGGEKFMWLSGPAGAGKTAIAGSVAEACKVQKVLAASFFFSSFSGSLDRRTKRCVISTIASHLAEHEVLREFKANLLVSIENNGSIFYKRLKEQAECLLLGPLRAIEDRSSAATWPTCIIIDGLDEVEAQQYHDPERHDTARKPEDDQAEILEVLLTLAANPEFPFRIFVSSRSEHVITMSFNAPQGPPINKLFLDSKYSPDVDVRLFLENKFADIRSRIGIPGGWPEPAVLDRLVDMSSGQFIVPATIIRWVESGVPQRQLADVLKLEPSDAGGKNPFATLDALYRHILKRANTPDDDPHLIVKWIHCLTSDVEHTYGRPDALFWRWFLEDEAGEFTYRMTPIASLIFIPPPGDLSSAISIYHTSLKDFLTSEFRSGDLYVGNEVFRSFFAGRITRILKDKGPAGAPTSPRELHRFLWSASHFRRSNRGIAPLLFYPTHLGKHSKAELATCDAAWWTCFLLDRETPETQWLCNIYRLIHAAMECASEHTSPNPV
ncbi:hypothetical protein FA13DRAFT_1797265 [Coprinellus micaceus]|uniref:Nephrocystin 3-like N-terminal domain-containing protein n=1 Tax=Coprinellus micaceus TaxID=71717 RepID=A0A4Y7SRH4_COPMI|nr:hypothetical protein FA13DRAFT_1797265 [Coprinellus micaceus]